MYQIDIPLSTLRAVRTHAAVNDIRYYLNGVYFDTLNGRLVGTDGHRCMIAHLPTIPEPDAERFIIANSGIDIILKTYDAVGHKANTRTGDVTITITFQRVTYHDTEHNATVKKPLEVRFHTPTGEIVLSELDGTYPDVSRIIPDRVSGELSHYNALYIADAFKAVSILRNETGKTAKSGNNTPFLAHNGWSYAGVILTNDVLNNPALILIMPMRLPGGVSDSLADVNNGLFQFKPKQAEAA